MRSARSPRDEQAIAADLFRFLVTRSKTKIAHPASDLAEWTGRSEAEATTVLEKLSRPEGGRILRRVPPPVAGAGETRYELFHDVLADPILEWRREYEQDVRRKAAIRRVARIAGGLAILLAIVGGLGIWALVQRSEAQTATRSATSLALASTAVTQLPTRPDTALLLGLEGYRSSPTPEAASAVVDALEAVRLSGATAILRGGAGRRPDDRRQPRREHARRGRLRRHAAPLRPPGAKADRRAVPGAHDRSVGPRLQPGRQDARLLELRRHRALLAGRGPEPGGRAHRPGMREPCARLRSRPTEDIVALGGSDDTVQLWQVDPPKLRAQARRAHRLGSQPRLQPRRDDARLGWRHGPCSAGTRAPASRSATRSKATTGRSRASSSARTGARSPPAGSTATCGCGARSTGTPIGATARGRDRAGLESLVQPGREDARVVGVRRDRQAVERRHRQACRATRSRATREP